MTLPMRESAPPGYTRTWERVVAADVEPGDLIAEARTHEPFRVIEIESIGERSRYLRLTSGRIRPRHTAKFWRVTGLKVS